MSDLISREALLIEIYELSHGYDEYEAGKDVVTECIAYAPAVDAVEVVFCKNCIYQKDATVNSKGFIICPVSNMEITDDDYCSYGERRESKVSE